MKDVDQVANYVTNEQQERGKCIACGQTYRLAANGQIPKHFTAGSSRACAGSNSTPART
jgi:hypothetical protein